MLFSADEEMRLEASCKGGHGSVDMNGTNLHLYCCPLSFAP